MQKINFIQSLSTTALICALPIYVCSHSKPHLKCNLDPLTVFNKSGYTINPLVVCWWVQKRAITHFNAGRAGVAAKRAKGCYQQTSIAQRLSRARMQRPEWRRILKSNCITHHLLLRSWRGGAKNCRCGRAVDGCDGKTVFSLDLSWERVLRASWCWIHDGVRCS